MSHLVMLPILVPLTAGSLMLFSNTRMNLARTLGFFSCAALIAIALALFQIAAHGTYVSYPLGDWPAPFGIALVLDRLSALLLLVTAILGTASFLYALRGWDERGAHFHALFQFQLMGVNGAFLTGDLFNLFVFFEVLLIASYGLLLHGGGAERVRAGIHYVVLNLAGSALFLIAIGLLYSVTGTLNLADLQIRFARVPAADRALAEAASLLLLIVFGLKAAAFPLYFWLPGSYSAAAAPVAALFAIMTKVGVYAMLRVHVLTLGTSGAGTLWPDVLLTAALLTLTLATFGALAARSLRVLVANLTVASVGTLMIAVGTASMAGITAAVYYLVHSTFVVAGLFLLAELVAEQRGEQRDALAPGPELAQPALLGVLFVIGAIAIAGLPPLSGFLGKVGVLLAARTSPASDWIWVVVLGCSALTIIALTRAGSQLFWKTTPSRAEGAPLAAARFVRVLAVGMLVAPLAGLAIFARPAWDYASATAEQLTNPSGYRAAVLGSDLGGDAVRPFPPAPKGR